jgi:hypothetical protein
MSEPKDTVVPAEERESANGDSTIEEEDLGIPSLDEPFLQKYLDGRDALIAQ